MPNHKLKKIKCTKENLVKSLKEVNCFLTKLGKCNKGKQIYDIFKKQ